MLTILLLDVYTYFARLGSWTRLHLKHSYSSQLGYTRCMNKKLLVISVIVVALILGGFTYLSTAPAEPTFNQTTDKDRTQQEQMSTGDSKPGQYVEYSEDKLAETAGTRVLFFHAPWCPQCRALEASIKDGKIPEDVTIFKVDYDSNQVLRQKYGVTIQTTLVRIDDEGSLTKKYVAYDEPNLNAVNENLLR